MIKIIGLVLIIGSAFLYGIKISEDLKIHYEELLELKKSFFLLKGEIEYSLCPIKEGLLNVSERCGQNISNVFSEISKGDNEAFNEKWKLEWEKGFRNLQLSSNEKRDLLELGDCIGLRDKEAQLKQIDLYLLRLEDSITSLKTVIPKKSRVYKCLSLGFGLFLTIIII